MTTYHNLGGGYKVSDEYINQGLNVGFTKEAQKEFFKAIEECNDEKIKEYLLNVIDLKPIVDINGRHNGKTPIIILAQKYKNLIYPNKKKAITILENLVLAHTYKNSPHEELIYADMYKAFKITNNDKGHNFSKKLLELYKTYYLGDYKTPDDSGNIFSSDGWETASEGELAKLEKHRQPPTKLGLKIKKNGGSKFVPLNEKKETTKETILDTSPPLDVTPQPSPAKTSAISEAGGGSKALQR